MPIFDAVGNMVVDIGGGTTDIAVMSLGGVVAARTVPIGGNDWNGAIFKYLKQIFSCLVSDITVEKMKCQKGTAIAPMDDHDDEEFSFVGRDTTTGLVVTPSIHQSELYSILQKPLQRLVAEIKNVMRQTPPELLSDIMERGIVLTGGASQLQGLAERLSKELTVPVQVAEDPENCVIKGLALAAKNQGRMNRFIVASRNRKGRN